MNERGETESTIHFVSRGINHNGLYKLLVSNYSSSYITKATEVTTKPGECGRLVDGKVLDWLPLLVEFFGFEMPTRMVC
jgi:hypothetical protein